MIKEVNKPWGKEYWIEQNDKYCYKVIHIKKDFRTSMQYHEKKLETHYIISGKARVFLGDEVLEVDSGFYFTVKPFTKHRIEAITDVVLHEASTPEVDDVVRIHDDNNRPNGRIESEHA